MHANVGDLIFTDGTEAGIVLAHLTDDAGAVEGLVVGRFAEVDTVDAAGGYGSNPGPGPDEQAIADAAQPAEQYVPTVAGQAPAPIEPDEPDDNASYVETAQNTPTMNTPTMIPPVEETPIAAPPSEADVQTAEATQPTVPTTNT